MKGGGLSGWWGGYSPWAVSRVSGSVSACLPGILAAPALLVGGCRWDVTGLGLVACILSL